MADQNESAPTIRDFVFQDALQRAFQISLKGLKEYQVQKKNIYALKKQTTQLEYEKRNKERLVEKRIRRSTMINGSRMQKMQARNSAVMKIVSISQYKMYKNIISNKQFYKKLLKDLIIEGLIKLFEEKVFIRCLKRDQKLIQEILPICKQQYEKLLLKELDFSVNLDISIHLNQSLIQRQIHDTSKLKVNQFINQLGKSQFIQKSEQDIKCFGGVILTTQDGLIICKNTLDARLDLAFSKILPNIRQKLFD